MSGLVVVRLVVEVVREIVSVEIEGAEGAIEATVLVHLLLQIIINIIFLYFWWGSKREREELVWIMGIAGLGRTALEVSIRISRR